MSDQKSLRTMVPRRRQCGRYFNGTSHGLTHPAITSFGTNDFFIDFFVYMESLPTANRSIYLTRAANSTGFNIEIGGSSSKEELRVRVYETTSLVGNHETYYGRCLQTDMWTYVHLSFDRSEYLRFYVDHPTTANTARTISAWSALNLVQSSSPCYLGYNGTDYHHCRLAFFGIGIGELLSDDDRTALWNSGRGLRTGAMDATLAAKFTHRWDLCGRKISADIGAIDLTGSATPGKCDGPFRKRRVYASTYGFATADSTTALTQALRSQAQEVIIDKQATNWIITPVSLRSNQVVTLEPDVVVEAKAGYTTNQCLLYINAIDNVTLQGGSGSTLKMQKAEYGSESENRMCLDIRGSNNVLVQGLTLEDAGGDCIYIGGDLSTSVTIRDCTCQNANRNNISVVNVDGLLIEDVVLDGATGTDPEILCEDCTSTGDSSEGAPNGRGGLWVEMGNSSTPGGSILIDNMTITNSGSQGVTLRSHVPDGPTVELRACTVVNPTGFPIWLSAASTDTETNGGYVLTNISVTDGSERQPLDYYDDTDPAGQTGAISWTDISGTITVTYDGTTTTYQLTTAQLQAWLGEAVYTG